jgi:hypothetical protein
MRLKALLMGETELAWNMKNFMGAREILIGSSLREKRFSVKLSSRNRGSLT